MLNTKPTLIFLACLPLFAVPQVTISGHVTVSGNVRIGSSIELTNKTCGAVGTATGTSTTCNVRLSGSASSFSPGETVHCTAYNFISTGGTYAVTDSGGNTYAANGAQFVAMDVYGGTTFQLFDSFNIVNSASTVTSTLTGTGDFFILSCFSTRGGVGAVDGPIGTGQALASSVITATVVPVSVNDLSECTLASEQTSAPITPVSPYTLVPNAITPNANVSMYAVLSSAGSQAAAATYAGGANWGMICGTYK